MPANDTDTKPPSTPPREMGAQVLRVVFSVSRPVVPPTIVRVSPAGLAIGRDVSNGLLLADARMSRHHATVCRDPTGDLSVVDHQSKNGTHVNGTRVQRKKLVLGDVISVGDSCLVVSSEPSSVTGKPVGTLVGDSPAMRHARTLIRSLGPTRTTVLLVAETGCGKEVVARALHEASGLRGEFIAVNCAAVPENLFESQFFGHKAGAFTGAVAHDGFFRAANGGTLFLDEIGELPLTQQPKLLRAIQERSVVPLGTMRPVPCDARIVAATNRDLTHEVERGLFRADLLARLFEAQILLPPLRLRREDVLEIFALSFLNPDLSMSHALAEALLLHGWPFNVRELLSAAREMVTALEAEGGKTLDVYAFRRRVEKLERNSSARALSPVSRLNEAPLTREELSKLLSEKGGTVADVARAVGRSRRQIYRWIAKYGLLVDEYRS